MSYVPELDDDRFPTIASSKKSIWSLDDKGPLPEPKDTSPLKRLGAALLHTFKRDKATEKTAQLFTTALYRLSTDYKVCVASEYSDIKIYISPEEKTSLFRYNNENNEITPGVWLSLYEGYGEEWITKYLSKKMHLVFKENLKKLPYDYLASLESTFHTANQAVLDILKRKHLQFAAEALCCWLQEDVVYVANCGGSKAIMISPSANEWLELHSKRHSVHDFTEKERIVKAGGRVSNGLINGLWTSSRFLGSSQPGIICAPDLAQKTISKDNVCIILLTSKEISIRLSTQKLVRQIARAYCLNEQCNANFIVSQIMQLVDTTRVKNFYNAGVIVAIIRPKSIVFL